ncbi:MAG: ornithine-acyl-ACP acyltransferase [Rhodobacteraceae bacterium GWE1_64_9]|nr:MAG: ornithine-acyl-ACP acyltransferase [Rhodobacteraceae bacterium GWE1_64_9]OHC51225.1 MAG: ornithine-acyl-ACP acyltransferase [Rhodobacteraceae bacterium GWF1_65_7]HBD91566.1 ornithine-acyl-ACP acyltransferase [Gemmobacter sp.]HBU15956.1 ornithine-acyl-ACP acyltransferase [Gemmobacter sp.]
MQPLRKGHYQARLADSGADLQRAQALRHLCFRGAAAGPGLDCDGFDDLCRHVLVEDTQTGALVCCYRLMPLQGGDAILSSYSAQFYELSQLAGFRGQALELGRFCIHPERRDPDILRLAWGAMTRIVDDLRAELLFGCASFHGTDSAEYVEAFTMLKDRHLAPPRWLPRVKAPRVFRFAQALAARKPDAKRAMLTMPPLLRTYLMMGGWVSDHAVVDAEMNTLHVFTGVEIGAIPAARARALRLVAAG